ncbi:MAG: SA1362 family protein [Bacillaceae bacterium]
MKRNYFSYLVYGIIALAIFGFVFTLINKPGQIVSTAFTIGFTVLIVYILIRLFSNLGTNSTTNSSYRKAVKQSKKKYAQKNNFTSSITTKKQMTKSKSEPIRKKTKSKSTAHLTVIEGEKGKKKKRMTL